MWVRVPPPLPMHGHDALDTHLLCIRQVHISFQFCVHDVHKISLFVNMVYANQEFEALLYL